MAWHHLKHHPSLATGGPALDVTLATKVIANSIVVLFFAVFEHRFIF